MRKLITIPCLLIWLCILAAYASAEITVMVSMKTLPDAAFDKANESSRIDIVKISDCKGASVGRSLYDVMFTDRTVAKRVYQWLTTNNYAPVLISAHQHKLSQIQNPDGSLTDTDQAASELDDNGFDKLVPYTVARKNELLRCLPDVCTTDTNMVTTCVRPTVPFMPHKFSGWGDRSY